MVEWLFFHPFGTEKIMADDDLAALRRVEEIRKRLNIDFGGVCLRKTSGKFSEELLELFARYGIKPEYPDGAPNK